MRMPEHSFIAGRNVGPLKIALDEVEKYGNLSRLGINLDVQDVKQMAAAIAMDADLVAPLTNASVTTPIQFLQSWLPGFVEVVTAARKIDTLLGIVTQGKWEDEEIVQGVMEYTGEAIPYGDYTNVPLSSWNVEFERRTVVRFEEGLMVGKLEELRASAMNVNSPSSKREAAARALEIIRNSVGFSGYNNGQNRTYGLLNDPSLPAYVSVPVGGAGDTEWATKTFLEITADIRTWLSALRTQSGDTIDPGSTPITLALATAARDYMSTTSDFGNSVQDWLNETYPNVRVESAPEFDGANGGENVAYLYADTVDDGSSDDNRSIIQIVPAKFQTIGVEQRSKTYVEDFSNATAGVMVKRPYATYRASGV